MPAAFRPVPDMSLHGQMQCAFWPSVRKVAFRELKKHTQVHTAAKDRASTAVLLLALPFWSNALASVPCATQRTCAPLFSWCPMSVADDIFSKAFWLFTEPGFYEQFGKYAINHKTVCSNLFWVLPHLTKWSCKVILLIQESSPQHFPIFYGAIKRKTIKEIATDRRESRAKGGV